MFSTSPVWGIFLSVIAYIIGSFIYRKTKITLLNPLLLSLLIVGTFLTIFSIPYEEYNKGGEIITLLLGPATVVLGVPLYDRFKVIKANAGVILVSIALGSAAAILSTWALAKAFGLEDVLTASIIPKSTTMAIALELSSDLGGIKAITIISVLFSGVLGSIAGPTICKLLRIKSSAGIGLSIGTVAHVLGTAKALEIGEDEGAMSSIAIGTAGVITVILVPVFAKILFS